MIARAAGETVRQDKITKPEQCICRKCTQNILDRGHTQTEIKHRNEGHEIVLHWLNNVASPHEAGPTAANILQTRVPGWSQAVLENIEKNWVIQGKNLRITPDQHSSG
ncbi:MAG: hypothetical protein EKK48_04505 [Candidatus Melainabacteria bacterium]|nr:MAG: hypothetical protein EKK48_04505 [Candidatus Melainabacteria bacterium]